MPRRPCLRCGTLTVGASYCPTHQPRSPGSTRRWRTLRAKVLARDGHACVICGATERLEAHHRTPRAKGGPDVIENLETRCRPCHDDAHRP